MTKRLIQDNETPPFNIGEFKNVAKWLSSEKLSGRFSHVVKPKLFQTVGILRPGVYFMDYAKFHKPWGWHNKGATGFMLAVENVTNKLFVHPCKTKETASWENAIEKFVTLTRNVTTIFSDRDTVVTSKIVRIMRKTLLVTSLELEG